MRKTSYSKKQKAAVVGGTVAALMAGGVALAAWTSNGTGTGTATAGSDQGLVVDPASNNTLFPTHSADITVKVTNNNNFPVSLDSITFTSVNDQATCALTPTSLSGLTSYTVPANGSTDVTGLSVAMGADSANSCQGEAFTLHYSASGHSVAN